MTGWLKLLVGTAVAIPLGIVVFIWWIESAFTSGGCKDSYVSRGTLVGEIKYDVKRLRCSGRTRDEFTVAVGVGNELWAAIESKGGTAPSFKRMDGARIAVFGVGALDVRVELESDGLPKGRVNLEDGKVVATTPHQR